MTGSAPKHSKQFSFGVCFVIVGMALRLPGIADRVFCLPFAARMWWPESAKVQPCAISRKTKPQLALELIKLVRSWTDDSRAVRVVGDIGYSCETILKGMPKGVHMTGRVRMDSALNELPPDPAPRRRGRPRKKGQRLPTPAEMFQDPDLPWSKVEAFRYGKPVSLRVHRFTAIWYHAAGNKHLAFVLVRDPSKKHADCVFVDTDADGAADPQCRTEGAVIRAPLFAYWSDSLVAPWFVKHFSTGSKLIARICPWYKHKSHYTFSDMLAAARRSRFSPGILSEAGYM